MKIVCIKKYKKFVIGKIYESKIYSNIIFMPYAMANLNTTISDNDFTPTKIIKSRYTKKLINDNYSEIKIYGTGGELTNNTLEVFYSKNISTIIYPDDLEKHFTTLKEYRKLKLEQLNNEL
jgi:hypothetical protein